MRRSHPLRLTKIITLPSGQRLVTLRTAMGQVREVVVPADVLGDQELFGQAVKAATHRRLWTEPDQAAWQDWVRLKTGNSASETPVSDTSSE